MSLSAPYCHLRQVGMFVHFVWGAFATLIACAVLTSLVLGAAAIPGIVFLLTVFLLQKLVSVYIGKLRARVVKQTDARSVC